VALTGRTFNGITNNKAKLWDAVAGLTEGCPKNTTLKGKTFFRRQVLLLRNEFC
jgi:hypothetical protein